MFPESDTVKWWRKGKKTGKGNKISAKSNEPWMKELVGDPRIFQDKPKAWKCPPQMGMDKIRATSNIGKYFVDFASNSSVHGINHLTAPHRHIFEKLLIILFIGGALATAILLSWSFWGRYQNEATILVIDHKYKYKEFTVVSPAILACPIEKIDESLFPEVFKRHNIQDTPEAREFFTFISNATYRELENTPIYTQVPPEKWLTILWDLKNQVIITVLANNMADDRNHTMWTMTEEGFCVMAFSYVSLYMSYDYWMANNWTVVPPPERLPSLTFFQREEVQGLTSEKDSIKASVYYPLEVPELEVGSLSLWRNQIADLTFAPQETTTSDDVKTLLSISQRRCKIPEEGGLTMWPIYTHNMCVVECKYKIIRKLCGCYPHFARPMAEVPVCNAEQLRCVGQKKSEFIKIDSAKKAECGCFPNCDTSVYVPAKTKVSKAKQGSPNFTIIKAGMEYPQDKIRRELLFGFNDFLAAVGGAGGLFLGASVLSFTEILYFITIHLFWNQMQLRREKKADLKRRQKIKSFFSKNAKNTISNEN